MNPHLLPKVRSEALLAGVQGMPCTLRISSFIPGHSCASQATVVACHLPVFGKGVGTKVSDLFTVAGCAHCHDLLDGRDARREYLVATYPTAVQERLLHALCETLTYRLMAEQIVLPHEWMQV